MPSRMGELLHVEDQADRRFADARRRAPGADALQVAAHADLVGESVLDAAAEGIRGGGLSLRF